MDPYEFLHTDTSKERCTEDFENTELMRGLHNEKLSGKNDNFPLVLGDIKQWLSVKKF